MSPELKQFYIDLQKWIDSGFPEHHSFLPSLGICNNLGWYCVHFNLDLNKTKSDLTSQFAAAGLDTQVPFNKDFRDFQIEKEDCKTYKNPARLAWIKKQAEMKD